MTYIPLNKIITNLYSRDNNLRYKTTKVLYSGPYYKTYKGKYFTGITPNDGPNDELIFVEETSTGFTPNIPQSRIAFTDAPTVFDNITTPGYSEAMVVSYSILKNIDLTSTTYKFLPSQHYPTPLLKDYKLGTFQRFFCVKVNEDNYLEIDAETFTSLRGQDKKWNWELYTPFRISWTLRGNEKEVERTNYNITLLSEKTNKRKGFQKFLRYNYLKFYFPNNPQKTT
tara:strand:- start:67 stop:747 length:681 start_codon:yes stop_codon:yes gene_type:complete